MRLLSTQMAPRFLIIALALIVVACQRDALLVTDLSQNDALEVATQLDRYGMDATLTQETGRTAWSVHVTPAALTPARRVLQHHHLPPPPSRSSPSSNALWTSPLARQQTLDRQRVEALQHTLQRIPGVLDARLHMAAPAPPRHAWRRVSDKDTPRGRVAVLLLLSDAPQTDIDVTAIQTLVAHALPGIRADDVQVQRERVAPLTLDVPPRWVMLGRWRVMAEDAGELRVVLVAGAMVLLVLAVMLGWLVWRQRKGSVAAS